MQALVTDHAVANRVPTNHLPTNHILMELNPAMRAFIQRQQMMVVSAGDDDDRECTFVAGGPGFVRVLDVKRLAWPQFPDGAALARRLTRSPVIGLLFGDLARRSTGLHVDGCAKVIDDAAMRRAYRHLDLDLVPDRRPDTWITVYVEAVYVAD